MELKCLFFQTANEVIEWMEANPQMKIKQVKHIGEFSKGKWFVDFYEMK